MTALALSKEGALQKSVSLYIGVSRFAVLGEKRGLFCFAALEQGATCTALLSLELLVAEVQCAGTM